MTMRDTDHAGDADQPGEAGQPGEADPFGNVDDGENGDDEAGDGATASRRPGGAARVTPGLEEMLHRMAEALRGELAHHEACAKSGDGARGKPVVDLISGITRTLDKLNQMLRQTTEMREQAQLEAMGGLDAHERERLAERVAARINERVEQRARILSEERIAAGRLADDGGGGEGRACA
jgi:hypothetical protein